jgi:hypothetical protein
VRQAAPAFSSPAPRTFCADHGEHFRHHVLRLTENRVGPFPVYTPTIPDAAIAGASSRIAATPGQTQ